VLFRSNHAEIGDLHARLNKVSSLAVTRETLTQRIAETKENTDYRESNRFFVAKSPDLGVAELQRRVLSIISKNRGQQVSSQPLSSSNVSGFHKLQLTVSLSAELSSIQSMLYEFEQGEPQIFVDQLLLTTRGNSRAAGRRPQRNRIAQQAPPHGLSARLVLTGYMLTSEVDRDNETP